MHQGPVDTEYDGVWTELYRKSEALKDRRDVLEAEIADITKQISQLDKVLNHLSPLAGLGAGQHLIGMGITDAVRYILKNAESRLSPTDVRDKLTEKGYDLSNLTAPMSSIYKILSRLADASEPEITREKEDNNVFYSWIRKESDIPF